jgi:hypothetical protein
MELGLKARSKKHVENLFLAFCLFVCCFCFTYYFLLVALEALHNDGKLTIYTILPRILHMQNI